MKIIAHRGYWVKEEEKNTLRAFRHAFSAGYGIETDIRDYTGKLVISHNIADRTCPDLEELLSLYKESGNSSPLALNIKADGLNKKLMQHIQKHLELNYFVFDMSVPEQVIYCNEGFRTFTRQSDVELTPVMYREADGIWMDEFHKSWISSTIIEQHLRSRKYLGIISSEIHGRDNRELWKILKPFTEEDQVMLCTDIPQKAEEYFYG